MKKFCKECGKEFFLKHTSQKYCSTRCAEKGKRKNMERSYETNHGNLPITLTCQFCGKEFQSMRRKLFCCIQCSRRNSWKNYCLRNDINLTPYCFPKEEQSVCNQDLY